MCIHWIWVHMYMHTVCTCRYVCTTYVWIYCQFIDTDVTSSLQQHVQLNIIQSMERSLVDGYRMCLTCMASGITGNYVDMRWSGKGLKQSLWVNQLQVTTQGNYIVRKLCFGPWLDLHAGKYTCHVDAKDTNGSELIENKTIIVNGMYIKCHIILGQLTAIKSI